MKPICFQLFAQVLVEVKQRLCLTGNTRPNDAGPPGVGKATQSAHVRSKGGQADAAS